MTTAENKPLNRIEIWVAEHAVPIFAVIAVLILIGAIAVFVTYQKSGHAEEQVSVLKPQVTKVAGAICDRQSLRSQHPERAARCAERIRIGLINCRQVPECRTALLAALKPPVVSSPTRHSSATTSPGSAGDSGGGDAFQPPPKGHQQPGPGSQPGPQPSPPPAAATPPPPPAPSPGNSGEHSQGNGPPQTPPGQEKKAPSGAGVEVCALSKCVGAEVDVDPKGLP